MISTAAPIAAKTAAGTGAKGAGSSMGISIPDPFGAISSIEVAKESSRREGRIQRTKETIKKIERDIELVRIAETEKTKRHREVAKQSQELINQSDEILTAWDSPIYVKTNYKRKGKTEAKLSLLKIWGLLATFGVNSQDPRVLEASTFARTMVETLTIHTEHMSRTAAAGSLNFNNPSTEGDINLNETDTIVPPSTESESPAFDSWWLQYLYESSKAKEEQEQEKKKEKEEEAEQKKEDAQSRYLLEILVARYNALLAVMKINVQMGKGTTEEQRNELAKLKAQIEAMGGKADEEGASVE